MFDLTKEQKAGLPVGWLVAKTREDFTSFADKTVGHYVLPLQSYGCYVGAIEYGHGNDLLWDGREWHIAKYGVFLPDVAFVSDYYGFPKGKIFIASEKIDRYPRDMEDRS